MIIFLIPYRRWDTLSCVFHRLFALLANTLIRRANCSPLQIFKQKTYFILWSVCLSYENLKRFLNRLTVGKGYDKLIYVDVKTVKKKEHKEEKL